MLKRNSGVHFQASWKLCPNEQAPFLTVCWSLCFCGAVVSVWNRHQPGNIPHGWELLPTFSILPWQNPTSLNVMCNLQVMLLQIAAGTAGRQSRNHHHLSEREVLSLSQLHQPQQQGGSEADSCPSRSLYLQGLHWLVLWGLCPVLLFPNWIYSALYIKKWEEKRKCYPVDSVISAATVSPEHFVFL